MSIWNTLVDWYNRNVIVLQTDKRNRKKLQEISHCRSAVGHVNSGKYFPPCLEASHWGSATIFCLSNPASYAVVDLKDVALTNFLRLVDYSHNSTTRLF
jgi:hypothetical protein